MDELTPHPLVINVALELGKPDPNNPNPNPGTFEKAAIALQTAATTASLPAAGNALAAVAAAKNANARNQAQDVADEQENLAKEFADQANVAAVSLFAGYLGGAVDHYGIDDYRLLYVDALLTDWILIQVTDIVAHERLSTENAPAGVIDMLWVKATANLVTGTGPRANAGRFLVGELTRAGDFAPSTRGGTFSAASGLLCEATTPGCCRPSRTTCAH